MARSRRESLLSDGITDQKCPQGLLQQNLSQAAMSIRSKAAHIRVHAAYQKCVAKTVQRR